MPIKYKIITTIIVGIICIGTFVLMINKKDEPPKKEEIYEDIILLGTEDEYGDKENLSYHTSTGGEFEDALMEDVTNIVLTYNEQILFENGLDDYGINSLDDYILRYLNYYIGEDIYEVTVQENSYEDDINYPSFMVNVKSQNNEELIYNIKCIYKVHYKRYSFTCDDIQNSINKAENPSS